MHVRIRQDRQMVPQRGQRVAIADLHTGQVHKFQIGRATAIIPKAVNGNAHHFAVQFQQFGVVRAVRIQPPDMNVLIIR